MSYKAKVREKKIDSILDSFKVFGKVELSDHHKERVKELIERYREHKRTSDTTLLTLAAIFIVLRLDGFPVSDTIFVPDGLRKVRFNTIVQNLNVILTKEEKKKLIDAQFTVNKERVRLLIECLIKDNVEEYDPRLVEEILNDTLRFYDLITEHCYSKPISSKIAAALYLAIKTRGLGITQSKVGMLLGVTEVTIRNIIRELRLREVAIC